MVVHVDDVNGVVMHFLTKLTNFFFVRQSETSQRKERKGQTKSKEEKEKD